MSDEARPTLLDGRIQKGGTEDEHFDRVQRNLTLLMVSNERNMKKTRKELENLEQKRGIQDSPVVVMLV